jgi:hypothetical protein
MGEILTPIPFVAFIGISALICAWYYFIPAEYPVVIHACSQVFKSDDTRYVQLFTKTKAVDRITTFDVKARGEKAKPKTQQVKHTICRKSWYYNAKRKRKMFRC